MQIKEDAGPRCHITRRAKNKSMRSAARYVVGNLRMKNGSGLSDTEPNIYTIIIFLRKAFA